MAASALLIVLLVLPMLVSARLGGDCYPPTNKTSFLVQTQADMDALYAGCTRIIGSLDIVCAANPGVGNAITDVEVFQFVREITGYLHVEGCAQLPNLNGFRSLTVIGGQALYSSPSAQGFALYLANNALISDMTGFAALNTINKGRVLVSGSSSMCFLDRVDWPRILGPTWYRLISLSGGTAAFCQTKICDSSCTCGYCVAAGASNCQGTCSTGSNTDTVIIISLVLITLFIILILLLLWMCMTNRCGCRFRCGRKVVQWGVLPSPKISTWEITRKRSSVMPLTAEAGEYKDPFAVALTEFSTSNSGPAAGGSPAAASGAGTAGGAGASPSDGNGARDQPISMSYPRASASSGLPTTSTTTTANTSSPVAGGRSRGSNTWASAAPVYQPASNSPRGVRGSQDGDGDYLSVGDATYSQPNTGGRGSRGHVGHSSNAGAGEAAEPDFGATAVAAWNALQSTNAANGTGALRPVSDRSLGGGARPRRVTPLDSASSTSIKPPPPTSMPPAIVSLWARGESSNVGGDQGSGPAAAAGHGGETMA